MLFDAVSRLPHWQTLNIEETSSVFPGAVWRILAMRPSATRLSGIAAGKVCTGRASLVTASRDSWGGSVV